jgi:N,N'-diacetylchitobiose phosphorylase
MQFGSFDDNAKEYVITRPDTPRSWSNYLGSTDYGAVITNNAGGYGFYKSGAQGRFLRLHFNSIPMDQPGRYLYLRDRATGDFWSASWQPVGKPLDQYRSVCRHGTGYTVIESEYSGILTETTYFVPLGQTFEYWRLRVTNRTDEPRALSLFTYCEFSNHWSTHQDLVNLQYTIFIVRADFRNDLLRVDINDHLDPDLRRGVDSGQSRHAWMAIVGAPVAGFDTSREEFLGAYRSYDRPQTVERGRCGNSRAFGDGACGTLQTDLELAPGESRELLVLLGIGDAEGVGRAVMEKFGSLRSAAEQFDLLKKDWHSKLGALTVRTPDPDFDHMVNVWNVYNCLITFNWSRAASLIYNGERDGLGFRDSVQDVLGVLPATPEAARERLELMLTGQLSSGGAMPVIRPFDHHPGREAGPGEENYRSDDCLWFFNAIPAYVAETGDLDFYRKILPYADGGEGTVLEHLRRALEFNLLRTGKHGLPCGLAADWNDCLRLGYHGESVFVAFQLRLGLDAYADAARRMDQPEEESWARTARSALDPVIRKHTWDGEWFIWAIAEDGTVFGTRKYPVEEGLIYLNTQVWALISGAATPDQARRAMQSVHERLATPYGLMLCAPPFVKTSDRVMRAVLFNPGIKENAGIFNHTQGWAVMAECMLGHGDQAYEYYRAFMPSAYNDRAEVRQIEPYVHNQTTYSKYSEKFGAARVPWLTGAAAWAYFSGVQYILGLRPEADGLRIDPCIPREWPGFDATRRFRGRLLEIKVANPDGVCRGVASLRLNGESLEGNFVPVAKLAGRNRIEVVLGG